MEEGNSVGEILKKYESQLSKLTSNEKLMAKSIETPLGNILAVSNEAALVFVIFVDSRYFDREMNAFIKMHGKPIIEKDVPPLTMVETEIKDYFSGKLRVFKTPYEINADFSDFQRKVLDQIYKIGYGTTVSFNDLAKAVGKKSAAQPVANVCGKNPISLVIPSHRVVPVSRATESMSSCTVRRDWLIDHEEKYLEDD